MKISINFLAILLLIYISSLDSKAQSKPVVTKPNIIVFMVDDMGWQDTSLPFWTITTPFNKLYHTPNMERLAKEGIKFTNAYAAPVCTPTRTSMISGVSPAHSRITNWTSPEYNNSSEPKDQQFLPLDWNYNGISPQSGIPHTYYAKMFPQLLKDAGYYTIHVGKAHFGSMGTPSASPYNLGFQVNVSGHAAGHPQSYLGTENFGNGPGKSQWQAVPDLEEYYGKDVFLTEALTKEALKTIDEPIRNKQPFYLNMSHYAIHAPLTADNRYIKKYENLGLDIKEARYASMIEGMDKSLGDIMDYLKEKHVDNNTIIIFMSDNGGLSMPPTRAGESHTQNLPLKSGKGSVFEGGIRVPMIVKWPGIVKPASTANQYVIIEDFFPTILEMAGIKKYTIPQQVDGQSFVPILKNPAYKDDQRALIWHIPNKWTTVDGPGINYFSAIRKGDWKLIYNMREGSMQLYNLKEDIGEKLDLSKEFPAKVIDLAKVLSIQLRTWNADMPVDKATNKVVSMPDQLLLK